MQRSDISAAEVRAFLETLHNRYGYDLRNYAPASMGRRVKRALVRSGMSDLGELQRRIVDDAQLFARILEDLTIRVSEMFRDPGFYAAFRSRVVPVLRTYPSLRIWHSGCAAGEEPYASAIILHEEGLYERTQLYATDLSAQAIEQAKQGIYSVKQLSTFADSYQKSGGKSDFSSYYTAAYDFFAIKEGLRRNILFFQHNLVSDYEFGEMHVIFCRNVLIYFDRELQSRVLAKFAASLCPGGFLCLGSSERLSRADDAFSEFAPQERIYRREGPQ
jgi:chemotaxis protein methyltransferase CheR